MGEMSFLFSLFFSLLLSVLLYKLPLPTTGLYILFWWITNSCLLFPNCAGQVFVNDNWSCCCPVFAGLNNEGKEVFLRDIWPTRAEIQVVEKEFVIPAMFKEVYSKIGVSVNTVHARGYWIYNAKEFIFTHNFRNICKPITQIS